MSERHERLFFALWPDDKVRQALEDSVSSLAYTSSQARPVRTSNLHMTLHFLGNVPSANIGCFVRQAETVQGPPFDLKLTHIGHFKKPQVLWIGCESIPPALSRLHLALGETLETCGYLPEKRNYQPHVTVARKVRTPVERQSIEEIPWLVERFVLLQSVTQHDSVHYRVKACYPLQG